MHRDIKPSNVLLDPDGRAKVSDFGIAKTASAMTLTDDGTLLGTPGYVAPERLTGAPATPQSDLYSAGVLLYEALSGRSPFEGDSPVDLMRAIAEGRPVPLLERRPDLPAHLDRAVKRAMAGEPASRFATAADMAAALVDGAPGAGATAVMVVPRPHAGTDGLAAPQPPAARRPDTRRLVAGGVGLLIIAAVVSVIMAGSGDRPDAASSPATVSTGPPQPFPAGAGPLAPGRYRTVALQPPVDLTLDAGWALAEPEAEDVLFLKRTDQDHPVTELTVVSPKRVFLRDRTYSSAADYVAAGAGEPAPADLLDWLQRHPRLRVSRPAETRIGTVTAVRVDIEAVSPYPSDVCVGACVALFQLDAEPDGYRIVKLDQGETMRLHIARVSEKTIVVSVVVPTDSVGAATPDVDAVVKAMAFVP